MFTVVNVLPPESVTTMYIIARMDDAEIDDKIARGIINPTASRDQVLEQVRIQNTRTIKKSASDDVDHIGTVIAELEKRLAKLEKAKTKA